MKKYKAVLFDLDGTLLDTSPGIIHCYNETARHFCLPERPSDMFRGIIGGALPDNFVKYFGFTPATAREAVNFYREEYARTGIHMAEVYVGIKKLLQCLVTEDIKTAVATLKREDFACSMMEEFGLADTLTLIRGMDPEDTRTKSSIIDMCLQELQVTANEAVLVGDSVSDANGAKLSGIDFIGVSYGWGFDGIAAIKAGYHTHCAETVNELHALLLQKG